MRHVDAVNVLQAHGFQVAQFSTGRYATLNREGTYILSWSNGGRSGSGLVTHVRYGRVGGYMDKRVAFADTVSNTQKVREFVFLWDRVDDYYNGHWYSLRFDPDDLNRMVVVSASNQAIEIMHACYVWGSLAEMVAAVDVPYSCQAIAQEVMDGYFPFSILVEVMEIEGVIFVPIS